MTRLAMEGSKSSLAVFPKGAAISSLDSHSPPPPPSHDTHSPPRFTGPYLPPPSRSSSCTYPDLVYCTIAMAHDSSRRFHRVDRMRFVFTSRIIMSLRAKEYSLFSLFVFTDRRIDRQTNRQAGRQIDKQTDRQADRQTHRQVDRQTDRRRVENKCTNTF